MNAKPKFTGPHQPLTKEELARRATALDLHARAQETPPVEPPLVPEFESCIRAILSATPENRAAVFRLVAPEALRVARAFGITDIAAVDRLQRAAEIVLLQHYDQDTIQEWLVEAVRTSNEVTAVAKNSEQRDFNSESAKIGRRLIVHRANEVAPEAIDFIWDGRIATGKLTLIGGKPGLGKSQLCAFIAATVSNGGAWPCGEGKSPVGNVVIFSAEDGLADTTIPRLIAVGADLTRIRTVSGVESGKRRKTFDLKADIDLLESLVRSWGDVRLIVIDPISAYFGKADGNGNTETRSVLEPLAEMASRLGIAVVAVTHLNKGGGGSQGTMERFVGSIAVIAAARAAFLLAENDENEGELLLLQVKANISSRPKGLSFRLEQCLIPNDILVSRIAWGTSYIERSADAVLARSQGDHAVDRGGAEEVMEFLRTLLADGPVSVREIQSQAVEAGLLAEGKPITQNKMFRRVRDKLSIKSGKQGFGGKGGWQWELPSNCKGAREV